MCLREETFFHLLSSQTVLASAGRQHQHYTAGRHERSSTLGLRTHTRVQNTCHRQRHMHVSLTVMHTLNGASNKTHTVYTHTNTHARTHRPTKSQCAVLFLRSSIPFRKPLKRHTGMHSYIYTATWTNEKATTKGTTQNFRGKKVTGLYQSISVW